MLYPMKLEPVYKDYIWGGNKLEKLFGKHSGLEITAESWELSCHKDGICHITNGIYAGKALSEVKGIDENLPVIVKFIDAKEDLSVQVHPSDESADKSAGEQGKAEMWYIVSSEPQSFIYYGFSEELTKERFIEVSKDGSICRYLNKVPVNSGDIFFIQPGIVHALGSGLLVAEIQQSSNTTFRIFDYLRSGVDGKLRPLHIKRAAEVVNLKPFLPKDCRVNCQAYFKEFSLTEMYSCEYFKSYRLDVHGMVTLQCDVASNQHLLFVEGMGNIECKGKKYHFAAGTSYLLPAGLGEYSVKGNCRALLTFASVSTHFNASVKIADNRGTLIKTRNRKGIPKKIYSVSGESLTSA